MGDFIPQGVPEMNQGHLPDAQQTKRWDAELCSRERVYSPGSQTRRWEIKTQIYLPEGKGLGNMYGIKKQDGLKCGERWLEVGKR